VSEERRVADTLERMADYLREMRDGVQPADLEIDVGGIMNVIDSLKDEVSGKLNGLGRHVVKSNDRLADIGLNLIKLNETLEELVDVIKAATGQN